LVTEGGARASSGPPLVPPLIHPCVNDVNDCCLSVDEGATEKIFRLHRLEFAEVVGSIITWNSENVYRSSFTRCQATII